MALTDKQLFGVGDEVTVNYSAATYGTRYYGGCTGKITKVNYQTSEEFDVIWVIFPDGAEIAFMRHCLLPALPTTK